MNIEKKNKPRMRDKNEDRNFYYYDKKNNEKLDKRFIKIFIIMIVITVMSTFRFSKSEVRNIKIADDWKYSGHIVNNKFDGKGELEIKNKGTYKGEFKNGKFDGKGSYRSKEGWTYNANFEKGKPKKDLHVILEDSSIWEEKDGGWKEVEE